MGGEGRGEGEGREWEGKGTGIVELNFLSLCIYILDGGAVSQLVTVFPVFVV